MLRASRFPTLVATLSAVYLSACASGDDAAKPSRPADPGNRPPNETASPLVIVTERAGGEVSRQEASLQYLHVLPDWPESRELDYGTAVEIGEFTSVLAHDGAVFVYQPEDGRVQKYEVSDDLEITLAEDELSFMAHGIAGVDAELIFVSREVAFVIDEASAQIARWNPREMTIGEVSKIDWEYLERDGIPVQLQQGIAVDGRLFTTVNWRNWETFETLPGVALGIFDTDKPGEAPKLLEDDRCAPSIALNPFRDEDGNVYVIGDGGLGFDIFASPKKTQLPQCVLRVKAGEDEFDSDFFVDVQAATGTPGFYTAHPMTDRKLLVNTWSPDVDVSEVADPEDSNWYWSLPPYFEYTILDLEAEEATPVPDLPRAAVEFSVTLRVDDQNYVQLYRKDGGTALYHVDTDASVTEVLETGEATDVQYLGRL